MHFYGQNPDVKNKNRGARFYNEAKHYDFAAGDLSDEKRAKFTFCSSYNKYSFVDKFNRMDHKIAVKDILISLKEKEHEDIHSVGAGELEES